MLQRLNTPHQRAESGPTVRETGTLRGPTPGVCRAEEGGRVQIRWRLRQVMATREVWTGKQLRELLDQRAGLKISAPSISALMTKAPSQVKIETLQALCTALQCTPN